MRDAQKQSKIFRRKMASNLLLGENLMMKKHPGRVVVDVKALDEAAARAREEARIAQLKMEANEYEVACSRHDARQRAEAAGIPIETTSRGGFKISSAPFVDTYGMKYADWRTYKYVQGIALAATQLALDVACAANNAPSVKFDAALVVQAIRSGKVGTHNVGEGVDIHYSDRKYHVVVDGWLEGCEFPGK